MPKYPSPSSSLGARTAPPGQVSWGTEADSLAMLLWKQYVQWDPVGAPFIFNYVAFNGNDFQMEGSGATHPVHPSCGGGSSFLGINDIFDPRNLPLLPPDHCFSLFPKQA